MKKHLLFLVIVLFTSVVTKADDVTIYGFRTFQSLLASSYVAGPVKFNANNPSDVILISDQTKLGRVYSGTYLNYKWYALTTKAGTQSQPESLVEIDMETGERTVIAPSSHSSIDMAFDYSTQKMFTIMEGGDALGVLDLKTGNSTKIANFSDPSAVAIACALDGTLYMVSLTDNLYKVNKETAACELVGSGLKYDIGYNQSMCFDYSTGTLYLVNAADSYLYKIDTTTGEATPIGLLGEGDSVSSMFIPYTNVNDGAPDRVVGRKAQADLTGANKVTLSWTNPETDGQGNLLSDGAGLSAAKIYRDGVLIHTKDLGSSDVGAESSWTDETVTAGKHAYGIVCENTKGVGGKDDDDISVYVGDDIPGVVNNFKVVSGDLEGILTWEKPTTGGTGGYFNPETLSGYKIVRSGVSSKTITINDPNATSYTDSSIISWGKYNYAIYAVNNTGESAPVVVEDVMIKPLGWIVMTDGMFETENGTFYDSGGSSANYRNSERIQMTLIPKDANSGFKISFTQFKTETYDYLEIYDGDDVTAPLIGKFAGEGIQDKMREIYTAGAVTFYFYSDVFQNEPGWEANIASYTRKDSDLLALSVINPITPIAGQSSEYGIIIKNLGKNEVQASDYTVQLLDENNGLLASAQGLSVVSMDSAVILIPYTPADSKKILAKAFISFANDEDNTNNYVNDIIIDVQPEDAEWVSIGSKKSTAGFYPISFYSNGSYSQTLYTSSFINKDEGFIYKIAYPFIANAFSYDFNVKVWMHEIEASDLSAGNILASDMTLVHDGPVRMNSTDNVLIIGLDNLFEYKGKNLVVSVLKTGAHPSIQDVYFYYTSVEVPMTWAVTDYDGSDIDVDVPMESFWSQKVYSDIKLLFVSESDSGKEEIVSDDSRMLIYPNPFTDMVYIKGMGSGKYEMTISDITGKVVLRKSLVENVVNLSSLSSGVYLVNIKSENGFVYVSRIIKQ